MRHEKRDSLGKALSRFLTGGSWRPADFQALTDVTFAVGKGCSVGVIGRNGAGKSTLLRVLSGIYKPDAGRVLTAGKMGTVISLTAGFQPELSAMDNIVLAGLLHGLTREQAERNVDDIVSFADLQEFLDVPVKVFSTGMKSRLGFSIAAHLDREILLLDEILAVGDELYKNKCLKKMADLKRAGVTIIYVSHDIRTVSEFSDTVVWLEKGRVRAQGDPARITEDYLRAAS